MISKIKFNKEIVPLLLKDRYKEVKFKLWAESIYRKDISLFSKNGFIEVDREFITFVWNGETFHFSTTQKQLDNFLNKILFEEL